MKRQTKRNVHLKGRELLCKTVGHDWTYHWRNMLAGRQCETCNKVEQLGFRTLDKHFEMTPGADEEDR